jgi:hypothetical protein
MRRILTKFRIEENQRDRQTRRVALPGSNHERTSGHDTIAGIHEN